MEAKEEPSNNLNNMLIGLNNTATKQEWQPLLPPPKSTGQLPVHLVPIDNNPFDLLSHCSDEPNDPFESAFHSAETYSTIIEEKFDEIADISGNGEGNLLVNCTAPENVSNPFLLKNNEQSKLNVPKNITKLLDEQESPVAMNNGDKEKIRDMIRQRVQMCIQSASNNGKDISKSSAEADYPLVMQRSKSYISSRCSLGSDVDVIQRDFEFRRRTARISAINSCSSTSSELNVLNTALNSSKWTAILPPVSPPTRRLASVPTVVSSSFSKGPHTPELDSSKRILQRSMSVPSKFTPEVVKEANSMAKLLQETAELDQSPGKEESLLMIYDGDEDDDVFASAVRQLSFNSSSDTPKNEFKKTDSNDVTANTPAQLSSLGRGDLYKVLGDADLITAGILARKPHSTHVKHGPMKATMPLQNMTKYQDNVMPHTVAPPTVKSSAEVVPVSKNMKFLFVMASSTPAPSKVVTNSAGNQEKTQRPVRRSSSASSIPSPIRRGIPLPAKSSTPQPIRRGIPSPVKPGIVPPSKRGTSPAKPNALSTKSVNSSGYGIPKSYTPRRSSATSYEKYSVVKCDKENVKPRLSLS